MKQKKAYRPLLAYIIAATLALSIAGASLWGAYRLLAANQTKTILRSADRNIDLANHTLLSLIERAGDDALFLANLTSLQDYLEHPTEAHLQQVAADFQSFANHSSNVYYLVRYIDRSGQEEVRIIDTMPGYAIIPRKALSNKSSQFYFQDCIQLGRGMVYVSALELSIPDTAGSTPAPASRFGTPVYDKKGNKRGIILLNYEGRELFGAIGEEDPEIRGWDLTFYSVGNDHYDNEHSGPWWFTFPNRLESTPPYPAHLDTLFSELGSGTVKHTGTIYSVRTILPLVEGQVSPNLLADGIPIQLSNIGGDRYKWRLVLTAPREWIVRDVKRQVKTIALVAGIGMGPLLVLLWLLVSRQQRRFYARQLEQEHQQVETARRLARTIAHEFRQPLAGLQLVSDLMSSEVTEEKKLDFVGRVPKFVKRLDVLVSRLLSFSEMKSIPYVGKLDILDMNGNADEEGKTASREPKEPDSGEET